MSRDQSVDSNCASLSSVNDEDDYLSDDQSESGDSSIQDVVSKYGYDFKNLFTIINKRSENGEMLKYNSPLKLSLFEYVPPTINFVTSDQRSNKKKRYNFNYLTKNIFF